MKPIHFHRFCRTASLAALSALTLSHSAAAPMPRRPSIILIVCDGLGYGDLSCYGQTNYQTPNLDRMAAGGLRATDYYAGDGASSPARAALLLGREPAHLQQREDADVPLAPDDITVAQRLQQVGYHTGLVGEWTLGDDSSPGAPWRKGFDDFAGYFNPADAANFYADYMWRYSPSPYASSTNNPGPAFSGRETLYPNVDGKQGQYIPDLLTTIALNFIKMNQPDRVNHHHAFFLQINYEIPGDGGGKVPTDAPFSEEPWSQPEKNRAAMIARLDAGIGDLLAELKTYGLESNTVIFFTSDTGPQSDSIGNPEFFHSAGPFRGGRGTLYEGGLRVPMLVYWPGRIPAGQTGRFRWAAWDFLPTALNIAFIPDSPANVDGVSVLSALTGGMQTDLHPFLYWQLRGRNTWHTVRIGDWEAVQPKTGAPVEIYDLKTDPGETKDVAARHPEILQKFRDIVKDDH